MAIPSAPSNLSITKLSVNSFSVKWSTLTAENVTSTSFFINNNICATIPVTLGTIVVPNTNYKVKISGLNQAAFIAEAVNDLLRGNNTLQLRSTINAGLGPSSAILFTYTNLSNPTYVDYNIISSYSICIVS